jgi:hypothetical protein
MLSKKEAKRMRFKKSTMPKFGKSLNQQGLMAAQRISIRPWWSRSIARMRTMILTSQMMMSLSKASRSSMKSLQNHFLQLTWTNSPADREWPFFQSSSLSVLEGSSQELKMVLSSLQRLTTIARVFQLRQVEGFPKLKFLRPNKMITSEKN